MMKIPVINGYYSSNYAKLFQGSGDKKGKKYFAMYGTLKNDNDTSKSYNK